MFGYVRPRKPELRIKDYAMFRAAYCGLCHSLKARCGPLGRFAVNYDFTVLAMLLSRTGESGLCRKRCMASPFRRRRCCAETPAFSQAADMSLVLLWWKLADGLADEPFWKRLGIRVMRLLLCRGFRQARARQPDFDRDCAQALGALAALEQAGCPSLDQAADKFAGLLAAVAAAEAEPDRQRILRQLFYQLGRFIYIADAAADREEDQRAGRYNPVTARFGSPLTAAQTAALRETLDASAAQTAAAFALLEETRFTPVLENIMTMGLPDAADAALRGRRRGGEKRKRNEWIE